MIKSVTFFLKTYVNERNVFRYFFINYFHVIPRFRICQSVFFMKNYIKYRFQPKKHALFGAKNEMVTQKVEGGRFRTELHVRLEGIVTEELVIALKVNAKNLSVIHTTKHLLLSL